MKPWFAELQAGGHGPHLYAGIEVKASPGASLRAFVRGLTLSGFRYHRVEGKRRINEAGPADYDLYADERGFEAVVSLVERGALLSYISYHIITVNEDHVTFERVYGGIHGEFGERCSEGEMALLTALCSAPGLDIVAWWINAGGDGYEPHIGPKGHGVASLRAALEL